MKMVIVEKVPQGEIDRIELGDDREKIIMGGVWKCNPQEFCTGCDKKLKSNHIYLDSETDNKGFYCCMQCAYDHTTLLEEE